MSKFADIHSVYCQVYAIPHSHGIACHSTCPTCGGAKYVLPMSEESR